jgi:polyisoprenoid-binding protein YceI
VDDAGQPNGSPTVRGSVATVDGWPVPGATVTVVGPGGRQLGLSATDATGAFAVPVNAAENGGRVTVILAAAGVDPVARTATLRPTGTADLGVVVLASRRRAALPEPGLWAIDPAHSIVRATARHLALSRVEGRFTAFSGTVRVADPVEDSGVDVTIEAASIDTGNAERDAHLRSADFLDVQRFPTLTYRSGGLRRVSGDEWRLDGVLTIRDIARPVPLSVRYLGGGPDPWGASRIAFLASTQLARADYDMTWNLGVPGGAVMVGPTLRVELEIQAVRLPAD